MSTTVETATDFRVDIPKEQIDDLRRRIYATRWPTKELVADLPGGVPLYLYQGAGDDTVPSSHSRLFQKAFPRATIRRLAGRDHQLDDDLSEVARDIALLDKPSLSRDEKAKKA